MISLTSQNRAKRILKIFIMVFILVGFFGLLVSPVFATTEGVTDPPATPSASPSGLMAQILN
ncbi:MAG: hypothetical protein WCX71_03945, partial [Candidatus Buchananbacteria bacterium]